MVDDALAIDRARASTTMILYQITQIMAAPVPEGLK